jgi:MFS family permease
MRSVWALWRGERRARWFFAAHLQGGLGAAAGYIALMLLAYERIGSAWAATAVLLADLLPAMLLGPLIGGLIDRHSRLGCAIAADVLRAAAFGGLVFAGGIGPMLALAAAAGLGNALFRPATSALLPSLVLDDRLPAANALYSVMRDIGQLLGPACAAGLLLLAGPQLVIGLNAATFAISGALLLRLRGHVRALPAAAEGAAPVPASTLAGIGAVLREPVVRTLMAGSGAVILVAGAMNVAELVLAKQELGSGSAGFAVLLGAYGCGLIVGSLLGARNDGTAAIRRRYLAGLALMVAGLAGSAAAPAIGFAMLTFAITGAGNSLFVLSDRVLLQRMVPQRLHGRAFGVLDSIEAWGFAVAVVGGGLLASTAGGRVTFAVAGLGLSVVLLAAVRSFSSASPAPAFDLTLPSPTQGAPHVRLEVVTVTA